MLRDQAMSFAAKVGSGKILIMRALTNLAAAADSLDAMMARDAKPEVTRNAYGIDPSNLVLEEDDDDEEVVHLP
jgi:hypothetical protein